MGDVVALPSVRAVRTGVSTVGTAPLAFDVAVGESGAVWVAADIPTIKMG